MAKVLLLSFASRMYGTLARFILYSAICLNHDLKLIFLILLIVFIYISSVNHL